MPIFTEKRQVIALADPVTKEEQEFDKPYLLMLTPANTYEDEYDDGYREFNGVAMRGRKAVFDYLMSSLGNDDLIHSYILSGNIPLGKEVSLYTFLRICITVYFKQSSEITLENLNNVAFETSDINQDTDLDIIFSREANRPQR